ncbi:MAG: hypothetical protein ACKOYJ_00425, partial [Planctomycetia bacterium]
MARCSGIPQWGFGRGQRREARGVTIDGASTPAGCQPAYACGRRRRFAHSAAAMPSDATTKPAGSG